MATAVFVVAMLLVPISAGRLVRAAARQDIDPPSEVWTALAYDWHLGASYRPLLSADGYGGTRYFPGHVVLQAAAMHVASAVTSGFLVTALALVLLIVGAYRVLRGLGFTPLACAGGASLTVMSTAVQEAVVATRGDFLSAALAVCGLSLVVTRDRRAPDNLRIALAAVIFACSWMTKFTSVAAVSAAVLVLWGSGHRRPALLLAGVTASCSAALLGAAQLATGNRLLEIIFASITGRGSATDILKTPYSVFINVRTLMSLTIPPTLLAVGCAVDPAARRRFSLLFTYCAAALIVVIAVNTGYGIEHNHMIELEVGAALLLAACLAGGIMHRQLATVVLITCAILECTLLLSPELGLLRSRSTPVRRAQYEQILPLARLTHGPVLSMYPLVPILLGQRPFLLDSWEFASVEARRSGAAADLRSGVAAERFGAVVLMSSPSTPAGARELDRWFMPGFAATVRQHYAPVWASDLVHLWVARGQVDRVNAVAPAPVRADLGSR